MNNSNNNNKENNNEKKVLQKKRKSNYSLEDAINIYCCTHKIKDDEIKDKIKTIIYEKPSESIKINYDKDKNKEFPLSHHLKPVHLKNEINLDEDKDEEREERVENKKEENDPQIIDEIYSCFNCGWQFLKGMSVQEKNTHINLCFEGKGEDNKKELISTYTELENLQKNNGQRVNPENNNIIQNNDQNDSDDSSNENNNEEDEKDCEEDKGGSKEKRYRDENDDLML